MGCFFFTHKHAHIPKDYFLISFAFGINSHTRSISNWTFSCVFQFTCQLSNRLIQMEGGTLKGVARKKNTDQKNQLNDWNFLTVLLSVYSTINSKRQHYACLLNSCTANVLHFCVRDDILPWLLMLEQRTHWDLLHFPN